MVLIPSFLILHGYGQSLELENSEREWEDLIVAPYIISDAMKQPQVL